MGQLAAAVELEHRREQQIAHEVERAVIQPPEHVRDIIGERPAADTGRADEWDGLARRVERHRLMYEFDVSADGALGPNPAQIRKDQQVTYEEQRRSLGADIARHRESGGLPPLDQVRDISIDDEHALGRSL